MNPFVIRINTFQRSDCLGTVMLFTCNIYGQYFQSACMIDRDNRPRPVNGTDYRLPMATNDLREAARDASRQLCLQEFFDPLPMPSAWESVDDITIETYHLEPDREFVIDGQQFNVRAVSRECKRALGHPTIPLAMYEAVFRYVDPAILYAGQSEPEPPQPSYAGWGAFG